MKKLEKVWPLLIRKAEPDDRLDLNDYYVVVGPYTIQEGFVYGLPENVPNDANAIVQVLECVPGVVVDVKHGGVREGRGHGWEKLVLKNEDGSLIFDATHIDHCGGTGFSCPYPHGPRYKYGSYKGDAEPDPDFMKTQIISALKASNRWGVNYQPQLETFADFLVDVYNECGLVGLKILAPDKVYFSTERPLTPSLAFRLGLMMFDGEPRDIWDDQTEFTVWWD